MKGYPIVLTADRTLIADYRILFDGMIVAGLTTATPRLLMEKMLMPRAKEINGRAQVAPLGLRRIEAALRLGGFSAGEVAVVTPESVGAAIGPATRLVGICSGEPAGQGMNTSTMVAIAGGQIYPEAMFHRLIGDVRRAIDAAGSTAKVMLGGPGAWQVATDADARRQLGIDYVVTGYAEGNIAQVVRSLLQGEALPAVIHGEGTHAQAIPPILAASTMGVVEISRGCGLGCGFCTIGTVPMQHLPEETILADVRTNIAGGMTSIAALSEDFFRYGGRGAVVNLAAVTSLLARLRALPGLRLIQLDHANVTSIAQYSDEELCKVRALIVGDNRHNFPWVNVGVETASGALLHANGGAAKMGRCPEEEWGNLCAEQLRRLCRAGFFPLVSLIIGLPGETEADVRRTLEWVAAISNERLAVFPVLYAPIDGQAGADDLSRRHWQLIQASYRTVFRWIPHMYWDNRTGAGVPLSQRLLPQMLGYGKAVQWNLLFAQHARRARR